VEVKASLGKARRDIDRVAENVRVSEERRREKEEEMAKVDGMIQELEGKMLEGVEEGKLKELCRKLMAIEGFKGMLGDRIKPIQAKYSTCFSLLMSSFDKYLLSTD
jgi:chromosome segregation ATPase